MADEIHLRECFEDAFKAWQARSVHVAPFIQVKQQRQLHFSTGRIQGHVACVIDWHARLVLAEAFGAGIDVGLEHCHQPLVPAAIRSPRIDGAEGNQPVAVRLRLGQHVRS